MLATPKLNSIAKVLNLSRERHNYEDTTPVEFVQRTVNEITPIIFEKTGPVTEVVIKSFQTDQN